MNLRMSVDDLVRIFMRFDYPVKVEKNNDGFFAEYLDLPGCVAQGDTEEEAKTKLKDGREAWFRVTFEKGLHVNPPSGE